MECPKRGRSGKQYTKEEGGPFYSPQSPPFLSPFPTPLDTFNVDQFDTRSFLFIEASATRRGNSVLRNKAQKEATRDKIKWHIFHIFVLSIVNKMAMRDMLSFNFLSLLIAT